MARALTTCSWANSAANGTLQIERPCAPHRDASFIQVLVSLCLFMVGIARRMARLRSLFSSVYVGKVGRTADSTKYVDTSPNRHAIEPIAITTNQTS